MKNQLFTIICLLFSGLILSGPSKATAAEQISRLPPEMQQQWVWPDCRNVKRTFIITERFILEASRIDNFLYRQNAMMRQGDIYRLRAGTMAADTRELNDNLFDLTLSGSRLLRYDMPAFIPREAAFNPFDQGYAMPYVPCPAFDSNRPSLDTEGLAAIAKLDRIDAICGTVPIGKSPACQKAIFQAFDQDNDGMLSAAELARAYRQVSFVSASLGCQMSNYFNAGTTAASALFARLVLATVEPEGAGLTLSELQDSWDQIAALGNRYDFNNLLPLIDNLSNFLHFLPAGPPLPDCLCVSGDI